MRKYTALSYDLRVPQAKTVCALRGASTDTVRIKGEVRLEGVPLPGASVSFAGAASAVTDANGTYIGTVPYFYGGNSSVVGYSQYSVLPAYRSYLRLMADQAGQDFDIDIEYFRVSGSISTDGAMASDFEVNNGTTAWFADAATGSYGFDVPGGWTGTVTSRYLSSDSPFVISTPVTGDLLTADIFTPQPVLTYGLSVLYWAFSVGTPDRWIVYGQNPVDFTYSVLGTVAGTAVQYDTDPYFGSLYYVQGVNTLTQPVTVPSNLQSSDPPVSFAIYGTYGGDGTIGGVPFYLDNGTTTYLADSGDGYYEFLYGTSYTGWTGTITPVNWITDPPRRVYTNETVDQPDQNYELTKPVVLVAADYFNWSSWSYEVPDRWFVYARNPADLTYSVYATNAGTDYDITLGTGTYYHVMGVTAASEQATLPSIDQYAAPPLPPIIVLEGSVFSGTDGSGLPTTLYMDGFGTVITDGSGYWAQGIPAPYTGYVAVADVGFNGSFDPPYRPYIGVMLSADNQDFVFWPTAS